MPRRKPICRSLKDRIDRVRTRAELATQRSSRSSLLHAAEGHNLAALILSDCAMPEAARNLCWRQFNIFATHGPHDQEAAKLAIQPLINLGRLHTRDGNGAAAYHLHQSLFHAAQTGADVEIDGNTINLNNIMRTADDHGALAQFLWTSLLADGLRALCRAGRWTEALDQAAQHHGIGERPFDGRQIAIIARSSAQTHAEALRLVHTTATPTAWESAVVTCLNVLCLASADQATASAVTAMRDAYLALQAQHDNSVFVVRLGATVAELARSTHDIEPVTRAMERAAIDAADAYAARDALDSGVPLTESAAQILVEIVRPANLGAPVPPPLFAILMQSARSCEELLDKTLAT